ncbi:claspin-like [Macrosteles quadrilineatus]|uniref:claspin-like n=1 Tax=Macrosteles quadrilineatus TaxID=74068 RepID=UPI0023E2321C|nr:claspin-like [Macrosteles quadrilineatus]XP_054262567.1 claspin-like [Macrosteles quadrilineatus]XP_054262568.1 claspin-like [Macrosteles quadrilineatus]
MSSEEEEVILVRKKKAVFNDSSDESELVEKNDVKIQDRTSDSDHNDKIENELEGLSDKENKIIKKPRRIKTFDSSSESEQDSNSSNNFITQKPKRSKTKKGLKKNKNDSSFDEKNELLEDKSVSSEEEAKESENALIHLKSQKNEESSRLESKTGSKNLWYNNTDLYDAEGSSDEEDKRKEEKITTFEDEENRLSDGNTTYTNSSKNKQPKKPTKRGERKSKTKAQEDIKTEIHKESQRLLREAPILIPYHRPKQRTLAEFLVRRKSTPKVPLKTSSDQSYTALRELEQREKEAELFYKSDSSEDEYKTKKEEKDTDALEVDLGSKLKEKSSDKDCSGVVNPGKEKMLNESEDIFVNSEDTNSVVSLQNQDVLQTVDSEKQSHNKNEGSAQYSQESFGETEAKSIPKIVMSESNQESKNKEMQLDNESQVVKIDSEITESRTNNEFDNTENKPDCGSNNLLSCEPTKIDIEEKSETYESSIYNLKVKNNSELPTDESKDEMDDSLLCDTNKEENSRSTSGTLVNTEEFSLRLSESQSENILIEKSSFKTCPDVNNTTTNNDKSADDSYKPKGSNTESDFMDSEDQDNEDSCKQNRTETHNEGLETTQQLLQEDEVKRELFKKYNVELKKTSVNAPKIISSNDGVIDLEEGISKPEVNQLMKRFITHLSYKKKQKKKTPVELSIVSAERDGEGNVSGITEEAVQVLVGEDEEDEDPSLARPGAKMARLRATLQQQIERQRDQQWAKRQQEVKLYEDEEFYEGEKEVCDGIEDEIENNGNDEDNDETEEEVEEEEDVSENEDNEMDDELAEKRRKPRSVFLDDEADESEEEIYRGKSSKRNHDQNDDNSDNGDESDGSSTDMDSRDKKDSPEKAEDVKDRSFEKKTDSKGPNVISDFFIKRPPQKKLSLPRTKTSDMFSSQELLKYSTDEEELPSFQKPRPLDEQEDVEEKLPETPFTSPGFQLTALENMDCTKYNWSAPSTPCKDFLSPQVDTPVRGIPNLVEKSPQVCSQDLENMCSGQFTSQPLQESEENQDFDLFLTEDSQLSRDQVTPVKLTASTGKSYCDDDLDSVQGEDEEEFKTKTTTKKVKKLNFSDEEDNCDDEKGDEAEVEADETNENDSDEENPVEREVEYDSEENEVEVAKTAGQFLDVEAELSEEEWSSEDEDERGLDTLEMEEADREKIDQRRLKQQLDQIHMKEMMKEDKKQVKLLQEMLLEDGELHSDNKRERLFRWSNNLAFGEGDNKAELDSDEEKGEEDEDEENWRKTRHERELFLQEHKSKLEKMESLELEESDSQLLRLGQKALKRLNSNSQEPRLTPPTLSNPLASPDAKKPFVLPKRGSFLNRGAQTLSRIAQIVSSSSDGPIHQPKNSRNFVFASISPTKGDQEEKKPELVQNKRKKPHLPLPIAKKPCIQKPKTANNKSLFEALTRVQS